MLVTKLARVQFLSGRGNNVQNSLADQIQLMNSPGDLNSHYLTMSTAKSLISQVFVRFDNVDIHFNNKYQLYIYIRLSVVQFTLLGSIRLKDWRSIDMVLIHCVLVSNIMEDKKLFCQENMTCTYLHRLARTC